MGEEETVNTGNVETSEVFTNNQLDFIETKDENVEQTKEDIQEEKVEEKPKEETRESVIERIKNKVFGKSEEKKEEKTENSGSNELEEDISDKFTDAAHNAKWTDEQIVEFAGKYNNKQLEELIPFLMDEEVKEEKKEEKKVEEKKVVDTLEIDEKLKPYVEQIEKILDAKYQEKIGKIEESLKTTDKERSIKEAQQYQTTADEFFDKASKDFPIFGTTDKLTRFPKGSAKEGQLVPKGEAYESRNAVWNTAVAFHQMGMDWKESLDEALVWYKGKNMEKEVRSKVLKDLKSNEKRVSPKRGEHTVSKELTSRKSVIEDIARRAGID